MRKNVTGDVSDGMIGCDGPSSSSGLLLPSSNFCLAMKDWKPDDSSLRENGVGESPEGTTSNSGGLLAFFFFLPPPRDFPFPQNTSKLSIFTSNFLKTDSMGLKLCTKKM